MQEIEKEEKTDTQTASGTEIGQFQALGENYPEAVQKGEQERSAAAVSVELDQNGNIAQVTLSDTNPQATNYLKSLMESSSKKNSDSDSNDDGLAKEEDTQVDVVGNVRVTEEGNQIVFTYVPTNYELFRLNKQEMGLGQQDIKNNSRWQILHRKNGTGCLVFVDIGTNFETKTPVFRRFKCSSPTSIQSKEEIRPGKYYGSEAESWRKIQPLFPGSVLRAGSVEQVLNELNAIVTAQYILCEEGDFDISNVDRSESICWYLENPQKDGRALWNIFKLQFHKPYSVFVPQTLCADSSEFVPLLPLLTKPRFDAGVPESSQLLAKQMDPEKGMTLLSLSLNEKVQELELQIRCQGEEIQHCPLRLPMNYWPEEKKNALWLWVLNQHLNGTIPIQDNGMVYSFGEEGVAVALVEPKALALLPVKRVRQEGTSVPPVLVSRKQWEDWPTDSERFLPADLRSVSTRQGIPFQNLVEILVMEWDPQNISPETWQCAPMGLLVGLGESTKEEKKTDH